jgi:hypothetical protein
VINAEAKVEQKEEIALKLLIENQDPALIIKVTGVDAERLKELQATLL